MTLHNPILKIIRWGLALFFSSTILAVVVYRFVPVYITPLMVIRCFQQAADGESIKMNQAAKHNRSGGTKHGASTISQQTAKNVFLWPGRSWTRKGFEVYFTALIELLWSKQRIMEVYLNSIEMGNGIYGADAVARHHFGKTAIELSRSECALITATLPNPRVYDSSNPSAYVRARRGKIENQMRFIPSFPKEGEDYDPDTTSGGYYRQRH